MGFLSTVLEQSKKAGRLAALLIILAIAGALSIISAVDDPASIEKMLDIWKDLLLMALAFYFATQAVTSNTPQ